jgi:uncharacterized protein YcbK (DUF882 family)
MPTFIKKDKKDVNSFTKITPNFLENEFACKHCGDLLIAKELVEKVQKFRDIIETPIMISSAYRCKIHNANVGGASKSEHLSGEALDIYMNNKKNLVNMFDIAVTLFPRVGIYYTEKNKGFLHVDIKSTGNLWWMCDRINGTPKGKYVYYYTLKSIKDALNNDKKTNWNIALI